MNEDKINKQINTLEEQINSLNSLLQNSNLRNEVMRDRWISEINRNIELEIELRKNK